MLPFVSWAEVRSKCKAHYSLFACIFAPALLLGMPVVDLVLQYSHEIAGQRERMMRIENAISSISSMVQIDAARQKSMQKIVAVIDHFNPHMPSPQKTEIAGEIMTMSLKYPVLEIDLICATITHESNRTWNPRVVSPAGAMGLMQIMPATGKAIALQESITWTSAAEVLFDPISNIRIGCRYLSSLLASFSDIEGALAAYNGGVHLASVWIRKQKAGDILRHETKIYVPAVLRLAEEYRRMRFQ
jgi:hypothetical protein